MKNETLCITSILVALGLCGLSAGFATRLPWALTLWPWPDGRLTYLFIASILASMAIAVFWIGTTGRWRAALPGTVNVTVSAGGMALYLAAIYAPPSATEPRPIQHAVVLGGFALANVVLFFIFRKTSLAGSQRMPPLVYASFCAFAVVLLLVGGALVLGASNVMPWPMQPRSAVLVGWIFLGDALYFLLPLSTPLWNNARAPLLSFLAYDLVLLPPLLSHLSTVKPEHQASLYVYIFVLAFSALLAVYYLFIHRSTRKGLFSRVTD